MEPQINTNGYKWGRVARLMLVCALLATCVTARAQTKTVATLTVTNAANTNFNIQVNGHYRVFTNPVTAYNSQIQVDPNQTIIGTTSNLYQAYISYPEPNMNVVIPNVLASNILTNGVTLYTNFYYTPATNQIQFISFPGYPAAVTIGSNWATNVYSTYGPVPTNYTYVPVPPTGIALAESSNILSGLLNWLNEATNINGLNPIIATNYIWENFVSASSLAALSNYVGLVATNATNFTESVGASDTNYADSIFTSATNYANTNWTDWSNIVYTALTWTTNTFGVLFNNVNYHDLGDITGDTNSIYMTNTSGMPRFIANHRVASGPGPEGVLQLISTSGHVLFYQDADDDTGIQDYAGNTRVLVADPILDGRGDTYFNEPTGNQGLRISGTGDQAVFYQPGIFYNSVMPVITVGTFTNFFDGEENTGTGATSSIDVVTIPASALVYNGDTIIREFSVSLAGGGGQSSRVEVSLAGGTDLVDTGTLTVAGAGFVTGTITITRTSAIGYRWSSKVDISGPTLPSVQLKGSTVSTFNSGSGWGASAAWSFTLTGSVATGDLIIMTDGVDFKPSHVWATLP